MKIYQVSANPKNTDPNDKFFIHKDNAEAYKAELLEDLEDQLEVDYTWPNVVEHETVDNLFIP